VPQPHPSGQKPKLLQLNLEAQLAQIARHAEPQSPAHAQRRQGREPARYTYRRQAIASAHERVGAPLAARYHCLLRFAEQFTAHVN